MTNKQVKKTLFFVFFFTLVALAVVLRFSTSELTLKSLALGIGTNAISSILAVTLSAEIFRRDMTGYLTASAKVAKATAWVLGSLKLFGLAIVMYLAVAVWELSIPWLVAGAVVAMCLLLVAVWLGGKPSRDGMV